MPEFIAISYNLKRFTIFLGIHLHTHEYTWPASDCGREVAERVKKTTSVPEMKKKE
jgi:hypothetical protein